MAAAPGGAGASAAPTRRRRRRAAPAAPARADAAAVAPRRPKLSQRPGGAEKKGFTSIPRPIFYGGALVFLLLIIGVMFVMRPRPPQPEPEPPPRRRRAAGRRAVHRHDRVNHRRANHRDRDDDARRRNRRRPGPRPTSRSSRATSRKGRKARCRRSGGRHRGVQPRADDRSQPGRRARPEDEGRRASSSAANVDARGPPSARRPRRPRPPPAPPSTGWSTSIEGPTASTIRCDHHRDGDDRAHESGARSRRRLPRRARKRRPARPRPRCRSATRRPSWRRKHSSYRFAKEQVQRSGMYAYRDRRNRKRDVPPALDHPDQRRRAARGHELLGTDPRPQQGRGRGQPQDARRHRGQRPRCVPPICGASPGGCGRLAAADTPLSRAGRR